MLVKQQDKEMAEKEKLMIKRPILKLTWNKESGEGGLSAEEMRTPAEQMACMLATD